MKMVSYTYSFLLTTLMCTDFLVTASKSQNIVLKSIRHVSRAKRQTGVDTTTDVLQITTMHVRSRVSSRFADVSISSYVVNSGTTDNETTFSVQIPESAFISNFTMVVDGVLYIGKIFEKKEAQKLYDDAKDKGETAGQVKHRSRDIIRGMDIFDISVNVAAASEVNFELQYQELLERRLRLYIQRFVLQLDQIVDDLTVDMTYIEPQGFSSFQYTLPQDTEIHAASHGNAVMTASDTQRSIFYKPSSLEQRNMGGIKGELTVKYDLLHPVNGGTIISSGDYFVHYFAIDKSKDMKVEAKNIMFVIDVSGSMSGRKIEQTREAMIYILRQLNDVDFFNIMVFSSEPSVWQNSPLRATTSNIKLGQTYVGTYLQAAGGTNINSALKSSIVITANYPSSAERVAMVVFLTDGVPTSGVTDINTIRQNLRNINKNRVSIFTLGFGRGVDFQFLTQISFENYGFARRIYEDVDSATQLMDFFKEVNNPVCRNVQVNYDSNEVVSSELSQTKYKQYFSGSEIVIVGKKKGNELRATVDCAKQGGSLHLVVPPATVQEQTSGKTHFTERLYAYTMIKYMLKKILISKESEAAILNAKVLNMSLTYNLVTPLTSLVIVQDLNQNQSLIPDQLTNPMEDVVAFSVGKSTSLKPTPFFTASLFMVSILIIQWCNK